MRRTFTLLSSLALLVALPALADAKPKAARWQPTKADFVETLVSYLTIESRAGDVCVGKEQVSQLPHVSDRDQ